MSLLNAISIIRIWRVLATLAFFALSNLTWAADWSSTFQSGLNEWGNPTSWGKENHSFVEDSAISGKVFRVTIHQGGIDPATMRKRGQPVSGTGFKAKIIQGGADHATLSYKVRFPVGFQFARGGKLPGLYGGEGNSGEKIPNGKDGFSFRLMWLVNGKGRVYAYMPSSVTYGTPLLEGRFGFQPGTWHRVTEELILNDKEKSNGMVRLWLDGVLIGDQGGLIIRTTDKLKIDGVFFDFFYGGNDDTWAAPKDTYVDFAEFEVNWH
jgi:hypothetical protein